MNVHSWQHDGANSEVLIHTSPEELRQIADGMEAEGRMLRVGTPDWWVARYCTGDNRLVFTWDWKGQS